jgi:RimJ/RimL family protein N-acetyltransferase/DNA-binding transcriptional MerR regulator
VRRLAGEHGVAATMLNIPHPYPAAASEAWIGRHEGAWEQGEGVEFAVERLDDAVLLGAIGLRIAPEHARAELGYWIGVPYWGRGYATEAARAMLNLAFDELGLNRVFAYHFTSNPASGRVLQKIGMLLEGTRRQHTRKRGDWTATSTPRSERTGAQPFDSPTRGGRTVGSVTLMKTDLLPIGRFARLTGLSIKALRHYADLGLLEPARVDETTGYRYYALAQATRADAIRRLRELELPLDSVREALNERPERLAEILAAHRGQLAARIADLSRSIWELDRLIDGEEELVPDERTMVRFELSVQDLPEERLLVVRDRVPTEELKTVIPKAIETVGMYLRELGVTPAGPPVCICPFPDDEGLVSVATGWPAGAPARPPIEEQLLPATRALAMKHTGPYDLLSRSYRHMEEVIADQGLEATGDPREVYLSDPEQVASAADYETLIVWPVRPDDELEPGGFFKRRIETD